jgi:hypothetical protein
VLNKAENEERRLALWLESNLAATDRPLLGGVVRRRLRHRTRRAHLLALQALRRSGAIAKEAMHARHARRQHD